MNSMQLYVHNIQINIIHDETLYVYLVPTYSFTEYYSETIIIV